MGTPGVVYAACFVLKKSLRCVTVQVPCFLSGSRLNPGSSDFKVPSLSILSGILGNVLFYSNQDVK